MLLSPVRAIAIADELIRAALPKLDAQQPASRSVPHEKGLKRRGGDPRAELRRELHDGLRAIAEFRKRPGKPLSTVAEEIIERQRRFQPMVKEIDPERLEMLRVRNTGLAVMRAKHEHFMWESVRSPRLIVTIGAPL